MAQRQGNIRVFQHIDIPELETFLNTRITDNDNIIAILPQGPAYCTVVAAMAPKEAQ